jgi:hypothetical protein
MRYRSTTDPVSDESYAAARLTCDGVGNQRCWNEQVQAVRGGHLLAFITAILPRFLLLVGWSNDQAYWGSLFGSSIWLVGGFIFLPWTTLIYGFVQPNGLTVLNLIFLVCGLLLDLSTWGLGALATRKQVSVYRAT